MVEVTRNPFLFRFCEYKKYHQLVARLEFYSVLKIIASHFSCFLFSRSTGLSEPSFSCLLREQRGSFAQEQALSPPGSICRKEGEAQLTGLEREVLPPLQKPVQRLTVSTGEKSLLFPGSWSVGACPLLVILHLPMKHRKVAGCQSGRRHLLEAAT